MSNKDSSGRLAQTAGTSPSPTDAEAQAALVMSRRRTWHWYWRVVLVVGLLLILTRVMWGMWSAHQLKTVVAEIQAAGEPILLEEGLPDPVPDKDNAAVLLTEAYEAWPRVEGELVDPWPRRRDQLPYEIYIPPDPVADSQAYLTECVATLELVEQAGERPQCMWPVEVDRPVTTHLLLPHLGMLANLGDAIRNAAVRAYDAGDHALALRMVQTMETLAEAATAKPNLPICHLAATAIWARQTYWIENFTFGLALDGGAAKPAKREQIESLITDLLDTKPLHESLHEAAIYERWGAYDFIHLCRQAKAPADSRLLNYYFLLTNGPRLSRYGAIGLRRHAKAIRAIENATHLPQAIELLDQVPDLDESRSIYNLEIMFMIPISRQSVETTYVVMTRRHLAAAALAIRLYEIDHGRRPETLDQLVPDYLPSVPADLCALPGSVIQYRPEGVMPVLNPNEDGRIQLDHSMLPDQPSALLYSVGIDGQDNGGVAYVSGERRLERSGMEGSDAVFLLDPGPFNEPFRFAPREDDAAQ